MLLGAVMKVPLDLATLGVASGGNACTGVAQLVDRRAELCFEATALEGEDQRLPGRAHELGVGAQRRVVDDVGDRLAVAVDRARHAPVADVLRLYGLMSRID